MFNLKQKAQPLDLTSPLTRLQQMNPMAIKKLLELKMQRQQFSNLSSAGFSATPAVGSITQAEMGTLRPTKRVRTDNHQYMPSQIHEQRGDY